ncbi:hypothetical protein [uncultured Thiothrix sp.]|uniref:hypothetical protein n=1 Tax=uncultured Thiothrix sp. TaxID=223185 RepID=UPI00260D1A4C|nr:hypothetical protein [uncultured Thiothrix sp.]
MMGTVSRQTAGFLSTPYPFVMAFDRRKPMEDLIAQLIGLLEVRVTPQQMEGPYPTRADAALLEILRFVRAAGMDAPLFADIVDADYVEAEAKYILGDEDARIDVQAIINRLAMDAYRQGAPTDPCLHEAIRVVVKGVAVYQELCDALHGEDGV